MVVFPALALNYLGQGALLLARPEAIANPFYAQLGAWSIYPLVALSTVATVIASQATISGTFSVTQQAIALGFLPRMRVLYTSEQEMGQIYIPVVNWLQLIVVILVVVGFGSSVRHRLGLRHRGHRDHDDHHRADLLRHPLPLEVQPVPVLGRHRLLHADRRRLLFRQYPQDRCTAAGSRCCWAPA